MDLPRDVEGGRIGIASKAVGIACFAFETALARARQPTTFGRPIFGHLAV